MIVLHRIAVGWLLLGLAGCYTAPTPPPIVIGHVSDRTRPDKAGEQAEQGLRLALHNLNKEGTLSDALGGRLVQVRHTDTRGALNAYEAEAVRLVSINRCVALFGGLTPEETSALDHAQVPVLTFCGQRAAGASNQVFYLGTAPSRQGEVLAKVAAEDAKIQRLVVLSAERRPQSTAAVEAFAKALAAAGKKEESAVLTLPFGKEVKWEDFMERIDNHKPQAILFAGAVPDFNAWHRAYRKEFAIAEPTLIYAGEDGAWRAFDLDPKWKPKVVLATAFLAESDKAKAFVKAYQEAFHHEADVQAALAYDGFLILADALKRAQPQSTQERLRTALQETKELEGVTGPLTVSADRFVTRPLFVARWHNGTLTLLKKVP